jgi:hypothetical protein
VEAEVSILLFVAAGMAGERRCVAVLESLS